MDFHPYNSFGATNGLFPVVYWGYTSYKFAKNSCILWMLLISPKHHKIYVNNVFRCPAQVLACRSHFQFPLNVNNMKNIGQNAHNLTSISIVLPKSTFRFIKTQQKYINNVYLFSWQNFNLLWSHKQKSPLWNSHFCHKISRYLYKFQAVLVS